MKYYATTIHLYTQMESKGILLFSVTLNILINCYGHAGQIGFALSVMSKFVKWGFKSSAITFTTLKKGLCLSGKILDALYINGKIVAKGLGFDEVRYGTLINGLCKSGKTRVALQRFWKMEGQFVRLNLVMYNIVVDGCAKMDF
ncbi:hypothetical protein AHAS_Ahas18G0104300 [Arachis hypogaea]